MGVMADGTWRQLRLQVRVDELRGVELPQLVPWVDGSVLGLGLDTKQDSEGSGLGMDPDTLLGRRSLLLPRELGDVRGDEGEVPPRAIVWRCSCGEPGCASIGLRVRREKDSVTGDEAVVWDDWRIRFGYRRGLQAPGTLRFEPYAYYSEFIRAQADRSWESGPHRTGRELEAILDARPELLARWGAALILARGYLRDGHGFLTMWLRHTAGRYTLRLPCDATADPVAEADRITERLTTTDPATWPECRPIEGI